MMRFDWLQVADFARRHHVWLKTLALSAAITVIALAADILVNVVLMPGVTPYTPVGTLVIVVLIAPPFVFALLNQIEKVRAAKSELAVAEAERAALAAAAAARNTFLANASHELRTPLNGIIGYSELLLENAQDDKRDSDAADLERVIGLSRRLLALLNDLLDLAKVEAHRMTLSPQRYDVRALLQDTVDAVTPSLSANRNRLTLTVDAALGEGLADPHRLRQCVLNLLSNAAKFTSDGEISVQALREEGGWLRIDVRDTGVGIAPERQVVLFEPFMLADGASAPLGTGLGLAVTRQLARLMGGDVSMQSTPNQGSCFTLRLPLIATSEAAPANDRFAA